MRLLPLAAALSMLCGCATKETESTSDTLAGNPTIETSDLRLLYSAERWATVENRRYDAYVVMDGVADFDSSVKIVKVLESIPDHSRDDMAREFAGRLRIQQDRTASFFTPKLRVYAVFYSGPANSHTALVFSYQAPSPSSSSRGGHPNDAYVTGYDPESWQLADGHVSMGENLTPDHG
jgi:hypothetical protein